MEDLDIIKKSQKKNDKVIPVKLTADSKLKFRCHKGVKCFTACCHNVSIVLPPYDILRLKRRLGLSSAEFYEKYAQLEVLDKTLLPVLTLKMQDDEKRSCPFVTPDGCTVYEDRPNICRYYPVGMASLRKQDAETGKDEFYFMVKEDHCRGFEEDTVWTMAEWRADQRADLYDEMNRGWMEILIKKKSFGLNELPEKKNEIFFKVSTDLDYFRMFVFESSFLNIYDLPPEQVEKMRNSDEDLLKFSYEWLKHALFAEETLELSDNEEVAARKEKIVAKFAAKSGKK